MLTWDLLLTACVGAGIAGFEDPSFFAISSDGIGLTGFYELSTIDGSLNLIQQIDTTDQNIGPFTAIEYTSSGELFLGDFLGIYDADIDSETFDLVVDLLGNSIGAGALAFGPDGNGVAVKTQFVGSATFIIFDPSTGRIVDSVFNDQKDMVIGAIDFRSDGVAVGVEAETNDLWAIDLSTGDADFIAPLAGIAAEVQGITTFGDDAWITTLPQGDAPGGLYEVDLFTGETSLVGQFPAGLEITGIAAIPAPSALGPLLLGMLAARGRRRR